jgi:hypothetical protein
MALRWPGHLVGEKMSDHISSKDNSGQAASFAAMLYIVLCIIAVIAGVPIPYVIGLTVFIVIGIALWLKKKKDIRQRSREKDLSKM